MTAPLTNVSTIASRKERSRKPSPGVRGLLQQFSPCRQTHDTTPEEVRFCSTDRSQLQVHPGRISDLSLLHSVHMLICSLVLLQVTRGGRSNVIFLRNRAWLQHEELVMLLYESAVFAFLVT